MKKKTPYIVAFIVAFIVFFILSFWGASSVFGEDKGQPEIAAKGAVVYCENTGKILFEKNPNERLDPYSTTKLLTALAAMDKVDATKKIVVSSEALSQGEASSGLKEGEEVKVKDLMYMSMIESGNDAAYALGQSVDADMVSFLKIINGMAASLGAKNSNFSNPNGLKNSSNYSTPYDMMVIGRAALDNEEIKKATSGQEYKVSGTNLSPARTIKKEMYLIENNTGIVSQKLGTWGDEGSSVALYEKNGLKLVISLMGCPVDKRNEDILKIVDYAKSQLEAVRVVKKGTDEGKVSIKGGKWTSGRMVTSEDGYVYLPKNASKSLIKTSVEGEKLVAPVKKGQVAGYLNIYVADKLSTKVPLVLEEDVEKGWFTSNLGLSNLMASIIFAMLIALVSGFFWIRKRNIRRSHARKEARRRQVEALAKEKLAREEDRKRRNWDI